jgi:hypothetical protein
VICVTSVIPAQRKPVVEVGRLEVDAELRSTIIAVHRAGIDDNCLLAGDQAGVPGVAIESEDQAGLTDDIDELLEDVWNTVIPHWHAEEVVVGRRETLERPVHCRPGRGLLSGRLLSREDRHFRACGSRSERRKRAVPQIPVLDRDIRTYVEECVDECRGNRE